ncbi:unnamed protein product [Prunus brigantina]
MPPRKKTRSNNMTSQDGPSHADSESRQYASSREEERAKGNGRDDKGTQKFGSKAK